MRNADERRDHCVEHLHAVGDGIGCAEIWEHLSDQRTQMDDEQADEEEEER